MRDSKVKIQKQIKRPRGSVKHRLICDMIHQYANVLLVSKNVDGISPELFYFRKDTQKKYFVVFEIRALTREQKLKRTYRFFHYSKGLKRGEILVLCFVDKDSQLTPSLSRLYITFYVKPTHYKRTMKCL